MLTALKLQYTVLPSLKILIVVSKYQKNVMFASTFLSTVLKIYWYFSWQTWMVTYICISAI